MSISCSTAEIFSETLSAEFGGNNGGDNGLDDKFKKESSNKKADDVCSLGSGPGGCPGGNL